MGSTYIILSRHYRHYGSGGGIDDEIAIALCVFAVFIFLLCWGIPPSYTCEPFPYYAQCFGI